MTGIDLSAVATDQLLVELARRCGSSFKPTGAGNGRRGPRFETKEAWARAKVAETRAAYEAEPDPSVKARLLGEIGKFELLAKRYKDQGI